MTKTQNLTKYIMALDQGTTSSRCIIFDKYGNIISVAQKEFNQIYPKPGYIEHDPMEIWSSELSVAMEAMVKAGLTYENISGIGITNQRETTIVWDKEMCIRDREYAIKVLIRENSVRNIKNSILKNTAIQ